jgi:phosphoribosylaminoimidazole-succinocarboxamide synthase
MNIDPKAPPLLETSLPGVTLWRRGKVRDVYDLGERLLVVATDRLSAFDVVLPTGIPGKGILLTQMSLFWFRLLADVIPNHVVTADVGEYPAGLRPFRGQLEGRSMIVLKTDVLPVECVVRGYLAGSGWKEYRATGEICGIELPPGLRESERLAEPIFTPAWKAPAGVHDENIPFARVVTLISHDLAVRVRETSLALYAHGAAVCERAGLILADTKFEFGLDSRSGRLLLVDEVLTPDSSRFWDAAAWEPGRAQASYDKQFVRDWLEGQPWAKTAPGPELPPDVVAGTRARYVAAFERITGASFARYLEEDVVAP